VPAPNTKNGLLGTRTNFPHDQIGRLEILLTVFRLAIPALAGLKENVTQQDLILPYLSKELN